MKLLLSLFILILLAATAAAQVSSSFTLGVRTRGATLPASCSDNRRLFVLTAVDGANQPGLYKCNGTAYVAAAGSTLPVTDTTAVVKGSADATKLLRFEVDGFTTGTTRVATFPNADITVARTNDTNTFNGVQTFSTAIATTSGGTGIAKDAPTVIVYNDANISTTSATPTLLTFNQERKDNDTMHSTSADTGRLTATTAGTYMINFAGCFDASAAGTFRRFGIFVNGAVTTIAVAHVVPLAAGAAACGTVSRIYSLNATDFVQVFATQDSGGALNVLALGNYSPEFSMVRLGP